MVRCKLSLAKVPSLELNGTENAFLIVVSTYYVRSFS